MIQRIWVDKHTRDEIPEGDSVGIRSVTETWTRVDGSAYKKLARVFIAKKSLIELIKCISKVVKPEEIEQILDAFHNYLVLCLDSAFTSSRKNYKIPCSRSISCAEDRCGIRHCGDNFANERTSLARPWICLACEFKIRLHFEGDTFVGPLKRVEGGWEGQLAEGIRKDLEFVYNNCVKASDLYVEPARLLDLVRQFRESDRVQSFEDLDRLIARTNSRV